MELRPFVLCYIVLSSCIADENTNHIEMASYLFKYVSVKLRVQNMFYKQI